MRKSSFAPSVLGWALAAVMAVALPGVRPARAASPTQMLASELPGDTTLSKATVAQTASALHDAVAKNPSMAASLTTTALNAKAKSKGKKLSAKEVKALVEAAISAAQDQASDIIQAALGLYPEYADNLNTLALSQSNGNGGNAPDGFNTPSDLYGGFGVGFGAGFPGSPGFSGSPPSGAFALPGGDLTSVVNG